MNDDVIGFIRLFAGQFIPQYYMACEGQILSVYENEPLFHVIGNTYGGNGVSTFALPDLRGRVPIGSQGASATGLQIPLGSLGGEETHALSLLEMPPHGHNLLANSSDGNSNIPTNNFLAAPNYTKTGASAITKVNAYNTIGEHNLATGAVSTVGQGIGHENRQPFVAVRYIICVQGIYPQRS